MERSAPIVRRTASKQPVGELSRRTFPFVYTFHPMSTEKRDGSVSHDGTRQLPASGMSLARFSNWLRRLADRRSQFEPESPFAANRRADWLAKANARMTDDGGPPRDE